MIGHLLQRLHGTQFGQIEIAPLERGLAVAHQGIDRPRIDALRLARTALLERIATAALRFLEGAFCSVKRIGFFRAAFGWDPSEGRRRFNARPVRQKKTAGAKCSPPSAVYDSAAA